jgi:large subunit ribosomal protein L25
MSNLELEAKKREAGKNGKRLAVKEKLIPAIVYGHGIENQALAVPMIKFKKIFNLAGTNTLLWLKTDSDKKQVLIYDYQKDPITSEFIHVDFYAVRMDEKIEATIPLKFIGVSEAVKDKGGILVKNMEDIKVKCLPKDLPHEIEVDLSALKSFEDRVRISDFKIGSGVEVLVDDKKLIVANAIVPRVEKEETGRPEDKVEEVEGVKPKEAPVEEGKKDDKPKGGEKAKK